MRFLKVLTASIASTAMMTAFSYWQSLKHKEQFLEPALLDQLLKQRKSADEDQTSLRGWVGHGIIGYLFTALYFKIWENRPADPTLLEGALMGATSGVPAVIFWKKFFELHPRPPETDYDYFYKQLLVAHIVFGITDAAMYTLLKNDSMQENFTEFKSEALW